ncbi:MAG: carbonic anhydrase [Firmicutes bacterium]|nr:carbonic anhydrase [Bacillota bacterium]
MTTHHSPAVKVTNPDMALKLLKDGHARFLANELAESNHPLSKMKTGTQQSPFAAILACADSRCAPEIHFDQGIGNLFVVRNAGNVADKEAIGSFQFATNVLGAQIIVVVGHTECGAVFNAQDGTKVELEELQYVLNNISCKVEGAKTREESLEMNTRAQVEILKNSKGITVPVYGCIYNVANGQIEWL